jgi:hypothetical protein
MNTSKLDIFPEFLELLCSFSCNVEITKLGSTCKKYKNVIGNPTFTINDSHIELNNNSKSYYDEEYFSMELENIPNYIYDNVDTFNIQYKRNNNILKCKNIKNTFIRSGDYYAVFLMISNIINLRNRNFSFNFLRFHTTHLKNSCI